MGFPSHAIANYMNLTSGILTCIISERLRWQLLTRRSLLRNLQRRAVLSSDSFPLCQAMLPLRNCFMSLPLLSAGLNPKQLARGKNHFRIFVHMAPHSCPISWKAKQMSRSQMMISASFILSLIWLNPPSGMTSRLADAKCKSSHATTRLSSKMNGPITARVEQPTNEQNSRNP